MTSERRQTTWQRVLDPEYLLPRVVGLSLAIPIVVLCSIAPGADYINHTQQVSLMRQLAGGSAYAQGLYDWNLGRPNQLFHMLAYALSFVFGVQTGCKIVVAYCVYLWSVGAGRLARHVGAHPAVVFLAGPLALGFALFFGMVPFIFGIALFLWFLPDLDLFVQAPSIPGVVKVICQTVVLFLAHESAMVLYAGAGFVLAAGRPWKLADNVARFLPLVFGAALALLDLRLHEALSSKAENSRGLKYDPLYDSILRMPYSVLGIHENATVLATGLVWTLAIGLRYAGKPRTATIEGESLQQWAQRHRFPLLGLSCWIMYFVFPSQLHGATYLQERFLIAAATLAAVVAGSGREPNRYAILMGLVFALGIFAALIPVYLLNEIEVAEIRGLLGSVKPESAIVELQFDHRGDRVFTFAAGDTFLVSELGGRSLNTWTNTAIAPVRIKSRFDWPTSANRLGQNPLLFIPGRDFRHYRYALIHSNTLDEEQLMARLMWPEGRFVAASGSYVLVESTIPVVDARSPDYVMPVLRPDCLLERLERMRDVVDDPAWRMSEVDAEDVSLPECIDPAQVPAVCKDWGLLARPQTECLEQSLASSCPR